ncbi:YicC family protein [Parasulfuritortus cantonensis]|uniref:YicC family protein n=1 Tax=Parasulfuritortus cantonensis TaxID=2528202 RepID=A0A4R1B1X8_9PROT|nr:YicC/YloC family endoribonuclease [Parasulfuritortus cantonensis]TCJ11811.1 YicC family protein [Parasulfuritortus cantonensis]
MATLNSMTGFGAATVNLEHGSISLELRAVNSRFLDLSFRMGDDFRALEPAIRERIGAAVKRGKMECRLYFSAKDAGPLPGAANPAVLEQLAELADQVRTVLPDARPLTVAEVLRWPGVLAEQSSDPGAMQAAALTLLDGVVRDFNASRAQEGGKLAAVIRQRVEALRALVADLRPRTPEIVAAFRAKLARRVEEIMQGADPERIHQEVALFAQKIDVDEELDRLSTHLDEVERVLGQGGSAGKRLDFLMQELNREANTLGSKAAAMELSQASVEMKVLIEQMREQVQNLE